MAKKGGKGRSDSAASITAALKGHADVFHRAGLEPRDLSTVFGRRRKQFVPARGKTPSHIQELIDRVQGQEERYRAQHEQDLFTGKGSFKSPSDTYHVDVVPSNTAELTVVEITAEFRVPDEKIEVNDLRGITDKGEGSASATFFDETIRALGDNRSKIDEAYAAIGEDTEWESCSGEPPKVGEYFICWFLPLAEQDAVVGDLAERYPKRVEKFGVRAAKFWYYKQVLSSIWPLIRKVLTKWGALGWVVEFIRRMSS